MVNMNFPKYFSIKIKKQKKYFGIKEFTALDFCNAKIKKMLSKMCLWDSDK
jgi:hypothetical protein